MHDTNGNRLAAPELDPLRTSTFSPSGRRGAWRFIAVTALVWVPLGVAAAYDGTFARLPGPVIPAFVFTFVALLALWYRRSDALRAFAWEVPLNALVLFHVVRAVIGADFLRVYAEGGLPATFALHAGPGDILSGVGALVALLPIRGETRRRALWIWNVISFVDIATVVLTAQLTLLGGDTLLRGAFSQPPYGAIPFLLVFVFATHWLIFLRLRRER